MRFKIIPILTQVVSELDRKNQSRAVTEIPLGNRAIVQRAVGQLTIFPIQKILQTASAKLGNQRFPNLGDNLSRIVGTVPPQLPHVGEAAQ